MTAGNWLTSAGLGDANIAVGPRLLFLALDATIKNRAVLGHPVMQGMLAQDQAIGQLGGALGMSLGLATIGDQKLSASAEGSEAAATNFSVSNAATLTPARRTIVRKVSDMARAFQTQMLRGELTPYMQGVIFQDSFGAWANDLVDRVAALATSATYTIGTSGSTLSWGAVNDGITALKDRGNSGNGLGLISAGGWNQLSADALSLGGAIQFAPQTQGYQSQLQQGAYLGSFQGVDWYLNGELDASGGDTYGLVLTPGAVHSKHQIVTIDPSEAMVLNQGLWTVEARRAGGGVTTYETASHSAVGWREQVRAAALVFRT